MYDNEILCIVSIQSLPLYRYTQFGLVIHYTCSVILTCCVLILCSYDQVLVRKHQSSYHPGHTTITCIAIWSAFTAD